MKAGDVVSPEMLHRMLAQLADPLTGQPLGRLPSLGQRAPVAGFDMTFSPAEIGLAHVGHGRPGDQGRHRGGARPSRLRRSSSWAEEHVFRTRTGAQGARQETVKGVVASAWLHYESREGDPQVHHHCVVLNRAQAVSDGAWRTLDSKAFYPWVVALSERHTGVVEDLMTERFGVAWREMQGHGRAGGQAGGRRRGPRPGGRVLPADQGHRGGDRQEGGRGRKPPAAEH